MSVNKVIIVGNLGADPEVRQFSNGGMVANVSIATTERWNDKQTGERKEATEWHRVQFNNRLAEIAQQYLRKGSQVYVEGSLRTRKWQDQNGQDRYTTEIRANNMQMLGGNPNTGMNGGMGGAPMGQMNQMGYQNQGGFQNQGNGFQNQGNSFNQGQGYNPNGFNQAPNQVSNQVPNQTPNPAPSQNPQDIAMSDGPVDDDIPF